MRTSWARWAWLGRRASLLWLAFAACGDDAGPSGTSSSDAGEDVERPPVLTFDPDMVGEGPDNGPKPPRDAGGPGGDEDAGPGAGDGDAGGNGDGDVEPDPFADLAPTNTPDAIIKYGGTEVSPGTTILGSHLTLDNHGSLLNVEWLGRVRNDFTSTLCSTVIGVRLKNAAGLVLADMTALADQQPYLKTDGTTIDCAGPGEVYFFNASKQLTNTASFFALEDVATIEWRYVVGGSLASYSAANMTTLSELEVAAGTFLGYGLRGVLKNKMSTSLSFVSVTVYLLNAGGQPLARMLDNSATSLAGYDTWSFNADSHDRAFPLSAVKTVVGYSYP